MKNIVVVGAWHLGSVVGTCLADAGHKVYFWDQSQKVASRWKEGTAPILEPGLQDLISKYWNKTIHWVDNLDDVMTKADWVVVAYDTPVNEKDEIEFGVVEEGFSKILKTEFSQNLNFFFTAQFPVGTSRRFLSRVKEANPNWNGLGYYMPENLRLGEAIKSFKAPDRMVLGVNQEGQEARAKAVQTWQSLIGDEKTPINIMSLESAEMVKHALNAFLGTCVVFANEVSAICETTGASAWDVMSSLKQDSRVGPKAFLRPGLGFSGGTLARDVKTLSRLSKNQSKNLFATLYDLNSERNNWIEDKLINKLGGLAEKKIVLLGVTYKPFTSTVRRSPAIDIAKLLSSRGARIVAVDPMADLNELTDAERTDLPFALVKNEVEAFTGADAAVVVTEWPQFLDYDYSSLARLMKTPFVIDTKNHIGQKLSLNHIDTAIPGRP